MHKIAKSLLPTNQHVNSFQRLINVQIDEMRAHDQQMANVKKDPKNFHPYPAPVAHPDIMASIVREGNDYNVEFEVVDDAPQKSLDEKKRDLANSVMAEATRLQDRVIPGRKRALIGLKIVEYDAIKKKNRTKDQQAFLDQQEIKQKMIQDIHVHAVTMVDIIEDLTEGNIDSWKPSAFLEIKP